MSSQGFSWVETIVKVAALVLFIAIGAHMQRSCSQEKDQKAAAEAEAAAASKSTPIPDNERSIAPGTYLGAVVTGRQRAMNALEKDDDIRKQQNKEADDFERRGTPAPEKSE